MSNLLKMFVLASFGSFLQFSRSIFVFSKFIINPSSSALKAMALLLADGGEDVPPIFKATPDVQARWPGLEGSQLLTRIMDTYAFQRNVTLDYFDSTGKPQAEGFIKKLCLDITCVLNDKQKSCLSFKLFN